MTTGTQTPSNVHVPAGVTAQPVPPPPPEPKQQTQQLTLAEKHSIVMGIETVPGFEAMQRCAMALASSDVVPEVYQGKTGNCFVALDIALRLKMSPVLVMQNLYLVKGKASWSGKFQIAVVNNSGLFTPLEWEWKGTKGQDDWGCRAKATRLRDGKLLLGAWIDVTMCKREGWWNKPDRNGNESSKWQSMPEQMFMYRSASYWLSVHYPEGLAGLPTREEIEDSEALARSIDVTPRAAPAAAAPAAEPEDRTLEPGVDPASMSGKPCPACTGKGSPDGCKTCGLVAEKPGSTPFDRPGDPPVETKPAPKRRGAAAVKEAMAKKPDEVFDATVKQEVNAGVKPSRAVEHALHEEGRAMDAARATPTPPLPESLQAMHAAAKAQATGEQPPAEKIEKAAAEVAERVAAAEKAVPPPPPAKVEPKKNPTNAEMVAWCQEHPEAKIPDMLKVFSVGYVSASTAWHSAHEGDKK